MARGDSGLGFQFLRPNEIIVYEPRLGEIPAHKIGMSTRIVYILVFAYYMLRLSEEYKTKDLVFLGFLWLGLERCCLRGAEALP